MRSSSYNTMINMITNPKSKPKFCSKNVIIGSVCNASLCINSGSCKEINITVLTDIIYMKKFLHADWLRASMSINPKQCKNLNFFYCRKTKLVQSWNWVQKLEIKLINRKIAKEKLTDGKSNLLFSKSRARPGWHNSWRNFYLIAWYASVYSAQPSGNFFINQHGEIFSCILLTGNQMIFLVQFAINKHE